MVFEPVVLQNGLPVLGVSPTRLVVLLIASLAGGAFGAALGALPSFIFTGFVVFLGEGLAILQRNLAENIDIVPGPGELAPGITGAIGFGMVTGPHIAFAGGVAATAYAGKYYPEMEPDGWDYHFGKNILYAFGTKPDILAVGAVFGALGMLLNVVLAGVGFPTDTIALTVFLSAMLARVAFDYDLLGSPFGDGYLDMTPFEREVGHPMADGGSEEHAGRLATEPWLPHQYEWAGVTTIGVVAGILAGFIYVETGSFFLGYGISAMSLLFLNLGVEKIPVTHHITLIGAVGAAIAMPMIGSAAVALLFAAVFGAVAALLGEVTQRVFYAHGGTHVDPPAMAIAIVMFVVALLSIVGVVPNSGYLAF